MSKKQKCLCSVDLLSSVNKALNALEQSRKAAKQQEKSDKKAIAALLEIEARIEDAGDCKCIVPKKKKKKKSKKQKIKLQQPVSNILELPPTTLAVVPMAANNDPDDLELIAGVGPKLAETLNELGVFKYDQIANWQEADIERIDTHLNFPGRIVRENWIEQAKALANGGRDEYVKVFGKEPR